jgi:CDP-diacylglycerol pyrophosphatase
MILIYSPKLMTMLRSSQNLPHQSDISLAVLNSASMKSQAGIHLHTDLTLPDCSRYLFVSYV